MQVELSVEPRSDHRNDRPPGICRPASTPMSPTAPVRSPRRRPAQTPAPLPPAAPTRRRGPAVPGIDLLRPQPIPPPPRRDVRSGGKRLGANPPLVLVRPRTPSTDAGDHLKPADADHPLRFECRIEITHKSISQNCGDHGAPRRLSERAVTAPLTLFAFETL